MNGNVAGAVSDTRRNNNEGNLNLTWKDEALFPHSDPVMFFTSSPYTTNERRLPTPLTP